MESKSSGCAFLVLVVLVGGFFLVRTGCQKVESLMGEDTSYNRKRAANAAREYLLNQGRIVDGRYTETFFHGEEKGGGFTVLFILIGEENGWGGSLNEDNRFEVATYHVDLIDAHEIVEQGYMVDAPETWDDAYRTYDSAKKFLIDQYKR